MRKRLGPVDYLDGTFEPYKQLTLEDSEDRFAFLEFSAGDRLLCEDCRATGTIACVKENIITIDF